MSEHSIPLQRIVLTGFMGSGKTTVGDLLARRLGWAFLDLDDEITRRCELSVPEIFSRLGELHFRREESLVLSECLSRSRIVLALGGGAPESEANRILLQQSPDTAILYLEGPFETLHARCLAQAAEPGATPRPVLVDAQAALQRYTLRTPLYAELATAIFPAAGHSPQQLAEQMEHALRRSSPLPETP